MTCHRAQRRPGFTLVELLTVVGIIALLIGILVPALARARTQAKKGTVQAELKAISDGLEMFHNDFGKYPDSTTQVKISGAWLEKQDPITTYPNFGGNPHYDSQALSGAHWLARAMVGPDMQGLDSQGLTLRDRRDVALNSGSPAQLVLATGGTGSGATLDQFQNGRKERKSPYVENANKLLKRDDDGTFGQGNSGHQSTGRLVFFDAFDSPVLYYKANPRAPRPFCRNGADADTNGAGVYTFEDNVRITGSTGPGTSDDMAMADTAWAFVDGVPNHAIGRYAGASGSTTSYAGTDLELKHSFINYIHDHNVDSMLTNSGTNTVLPPRIAVNPDSFLLMTAGPDGRFGTDDDVANFKFGGL